MKKLFTLLMVCSFFAATAQVNPGIKLAINGSYITVSSMNFGGVMDLDQKICGDVVPVLSKGSTAPPYPAGQVATAITQAQGCDEILNAADLKGKIALVRRGTCSFKFKTLAAQQAGAIACIVYMVTADAPFAGADDATITDEVTIPSVMITQGDGLAILSDITANKAVNACFERPSRTSILYGDVQGSTPFKQKDSVFPVIEFANRSGKAALGTKMYVEVTNPKGVKTLLEQTIDINSYVSDTIDLIPMGGFLPTEVGRYKLRAFGEYTPKDTLKSSMAITPNTYGLDDDTYINSGTGLASTPAGFGGEGYEWHHISYFFTGPETDKATFASFGVANGAALKAKNREVEVSLVKVDPDIIGDPAFTISTLRTLGDIGELKGDATTYKFNGTETVDKLITIPMKDGSKAITLDPNSIYAVDVYYTSPTKDSLMPSYTGYLENPIRIDGLPISGAAIMTANSYYGGGYSGASQVLIRLHTDGFVGSEDLNLLKTEEVVFFPNPTTSVVNVKLNLEEQAKYVKLGIMDFTGKVLATQDLNVNEGSVPVNLANYPAGTYFFTVKTDKAFRTEKIVKF